MLPILSRQRIRLLLLCTALLFTFTSCITGCATIIYPIKIANGSIHRLRGIAIDQDGNPLARATLQFKESEFIFPFGSFPGSLRPTVPHFVRTDEQGHFEVSFRFERLELVRGYKNGYLIDLDMGKRSWSSQRRKENIPFTRILFYNLNRVHYTHIDSGISQWTKIQPDGTDYYVDFSHIMDNPPSTVSTSESSLAFTCKRLDENLYLLTVRGLHTGGVIGTARELPYAPQEGYTLGFSTPYNDRGGLWGFFLMSHGGSKHARIIMEISERSPDLVRFHYLYNSTGNRFLFVPDPKDPHGAKDMYGWRGPIKVYPADIRNNVGFFNTLDPLPWWRQQEHGLYPLMKEDDFLNFLPPANADDWSSSMMRGILAKQFHGPDQLFEELSRCDPHVRVVVAENPIVSPELLQQLAKDPVEFVAKAAQKRKEINKNRSISFREYLKMKHNFQLDCQ